jgi:hypothetical protein
MNVSFFSLISLFAASKAKVPGNEGKEQKEPQFLGNLGI